MEYFQSFFTFSKTFPLIVILSSFTGSVCNFWQNGSCFVIVNGPSVIIKSVYCIEMFSFQFQLYNNKCPTNCIIYLVFLDPNYRWDLSCGLGGHHYYWKWVGRRIRWWNKREVKEIVLVLWGRGVKDIWAHVRWRCEQNCIITFPKIFTPPPFCK